MLSRSLGRVRTGRRYEHDGVDWTFLPVQPPPLFISPKPKSSTEAEERLEKYLSQQESRFDMLDKFFKSNGVPFDETDESISAVNLFFADRVVCNKDESDVLAEWHLFDWSYGLFLGDCAIERSREMRTLKWVVEDISARQIEASARFVFSVGGYVDETSYWRPNEKIIQLG